MHMISVVSRDVAMGEFRYKPHYFLYLLNAAECRYLVEPVAVEPGLPRESREEAARQLIFLPFFVQGC